MRARCTAIERLSFAKPRDYGDQLARFIHNRSAGRASLYLLGSYYVEMVGVFTALLCGALYPFTAKTIDPNWESFKELEVIHAQTCWLRLLAEFPEIIWNWVVNQFGGWFTKGCHVADWFYNPHLRVQPAVGSPDLLKGGESETTSHRTAGLKVNTVRSCEDEVASYQDSASFFFREIHDSSYDFIHFGIVVSLTCLRHRLERKGMTDPPWNLILEGKLDPNLFRYALTVRHRCGPSRAENGSELALNGHGRGAHTTGARTSSSYARWRGGSLLHSSRSRSMLERCVRSISGSLLPPDTQR